MVQGALGRSAGESIMSNKVSVSKLLPHGNAGITAGLQPGEIVATSSLRFLSDGMRVKIQ